MGQVIRDLKRFFALDKELVDRTSADALARETDFNRAAGNADRSPGAETGDAKSGAREAQIAGAARPRQASHRLAQHTNAPRKPKAFATRCYTGPLHAIPPNGDEGARTLNPCLAKAVLSQLSYVPFGQWAVQESNL